MLKSIRSFAACFAVLLSGCAVRPAVTPVLLTDARDLFVSSLAGIWDNSAQFAAAPASLKVPPSVNGEWLDLQHATFVRIDAPAIGDRVLYLEWKSGGPTGVISRQRIWSFRKTDGVIRMDFYAFVDGKPFAGRAGETNAFRGLTADLLRGYGPACGLLFDFKRDGFVGAISARECSITAASGRRMGIDATVELTADRVLQYRESGQLEDGRYAFRVPTNQPYRFVRQ